MDAGALDAQEDAQIDRRPLGIRRAAVRTREVAPHGLQVSMAHRTTKVCSSGDKGVGLGGAEKGQDLDALLLVGREDGALPVTLLHGPRGALLQRGLNLLLQRRDPRREGRGEGEGGREGP
jgi:hypothetical protein